MRRVLMGGVVAVAMVGVVGCGGTPNTNPGDPNNNPKGDITTVRDYHGAGSDWSATLKPDGTCTLKESTHNISVGCSHKLLASGFREVTVNSVSGTGKIAKGEKQYAIEVENYGMVLASIGESEGIIPLIKASCPTKSIKSNYILAYSDPALDYPSKMFPIREHITLFGTYDYNNVDGDQNGSSFDVVGHAYWMKGTIKNNFGDNRQEPIQCKNGMAKVITDPTRKKFQSYYTGSNGLTILQEGIDGKGASRMFGIPADTSTFDIGKFPKEYIGFYGTIDIHKKSHNEQTVMVSREGSDFTISQVDPATGTVKSQIGKITIGDAVSGTNGIRKASLKIGTKTEKSACLYDTKANGDQTFMVCTAFNPNADNSDGAITLVVKEK